jgi:hypothetical protein
MTRRFEPLHAPLPLARRLMRVLGAIIEVAVLPMLDTGQDFRFCRKFSFGTSLEYDLPL